MNQPGQSGDGYPYSAPVYEQSAYLIGYTWSVMRCIQQILSQNSFDLINFPEYGGEGFAFQINRTEKNWIPTIVQLHAPTAMLAERMGWPEKDTDFYRTANFIEGESIKHADTWMASSANIADFASEFYHIPRDRIQVVHCGIDCNLFRPSDTALKPTRRPTVLFVGTIAESKGINTLFDAIVQLRNRYPDILLRIVGGENDLSRKLKARSVREGVEKNVEIMPFVRDRHAIIELFQQADIFASPADHENGVANVYVEAMACGCPVIAGNTGGSPEAVIDGKTGFLVTPRDVQALTKSIHNILSDNTLHASMKKAARAHVEGYFAQEHYIQRVLSAYDMALVSSEEKRKKLHPEAEA
jgi:phosphatidylinositol alpha-1,6-mannosyltransferase